MVDWPLDMAADPCHLGFMNNPVQEAIDALGGRLEDLAVVCRVSAQAVWSWLQAGRIHAAKHAVLAAEECARRGHTNITVARLAGLEEPGPGNEDGSPSILRRREAEAAA